jgi:hypothetical protein
VYLILEYTHAYFENFELSIKDYVNYLTQTTLVSNYTNHMIFKVFFKYCKSVMARHKVLYLCDSMLDSYTYVHSIDSWWSQNFFLSCIRHGVILHYTENYFPKFCISWKSFTTHHCMVLLQVALVSTPCHMFVCHIGITDCRKLKSTILG